MQPPPRKVKVTQELKNIQVEQMTKLQAKHQAECDLLEDMRTFSQKKAAIEKEYAQRSQAAATRIKIQNCTLGPGNSHYSCLLVAARTLTLIRMVVTFGFLTVSNLN
ncbi:FCH and double SH3 domains 2 [Phyllostomus discolor]|uniref:FCH and double SH3 domains 2 n=1 Tax=Phyllostomus discolor TaxID=89673 RepID=A0A833ZVR1_9CHIR|nr:FCH and double SH3 domains 2 [Phyllostomus discolor]